MRKNLDRRGFLVSSGAALGAGVLPVAAITEATAAPPPAKPAQLVLGMASYTFRSFKLAETIAMTKRLNLTRITYKDMHLPLTATDAEIQSAVSATKSAGIEPYGCGVVYMRTEPEVERAFAYAKTAGMGIIVGVPNHDLLGMVQKKVLEYNIRVAIHNHGPNDKLYPSPASVMEKIKDLDRRIGLCVDVGHTLRLGIDPADVVRQYADRLIDVHIKDVSQAAAEGVTVEIGRGVMDIAKFLKTLIQIGYTGVVSLEYEKDGKDPLPGAAESIGYLRGVLAML